ncbi:helix-turn-helix transcriptional regulator [Allokutzneria sp. NRRL B-24872]|uniref:helix-turn-helix domain-containing protein n=1 Tax=Allokutzneria sp. NRRL B-24872 TaxID=1137961 RepID=UPI000A3A45BB|nr:helix-turn-helix transcriptional regulator [Allokutzneria sp. NRRL B-24872]
MSTTTQRERNLAALGQILKALRRERGMVQRTVGRKAFPEEMSQNFVSKLEKGEVDNGKLLEHVKQLKDFFRVDDRTAAAMDRLCQTPETMREWPRERAGVAPYFQFFVSQEIWAEAVHQWQDMHIPGLLQARGCMSALFAEENEPEKVEEFAAARLDRQTLFDRENPPKYQAVLHENALRSLHQVRRAKIAVEQVLHIVELMRKYPHVTVRILTRDRERADLPPGYSVVRFPDGDGDYVHLEPLNKGFYEDDESYVQESLANFDRLWTAALSREASIEFLLELAREWSG